ncbi:protoporphyrinogen oxidase [Paenilisteria rocourtiae]|uniref:Coproporphyrinogen III oxidase n=1 Tax=Listeria rocourtiae TaxID=647910 RepID=A0A4R6ZSC7_9LIST|nr:protoporphyrinogen oxidase [Listeria rocourtiae]EUJ43837.1 protoporphyrinogen oxidase [Listeria rocourtiae FSL F6-920]MBC1605583.1 protoporphyrinogen oxidase [Listeria rocourtiae]TDR55617.1 protoporphyrinogen oxidase [Listeria rocourtiae]
MKKVIIIGGGLTGLSAAYYLNKQVDQETVDWQIFESDKQFGGKFNTIHRDGFIIEKGPDSFLARKPAGLELVEELGLTDQLITNATGKSYIYHDAALHPIPEGSVMGIPTDIRALLESDLLTQAGKIRALEELMLDGNVTDADQSIGDFFEYRFGKEMVIRLIEPLLAGIYAGNIYEMSLRATFPQFEKVAKEHRSLMYGLKSHRPEMMNTTGTAKTIGAFRTLNGGLSTLTDALVDALPVERLHANTKVKAIENTTVVLESGERIIADAIIIAATHDVVLQLLDVPAVEPLADQPMTSLATISLAFEKDAVPEIPEGTGFLVARTSDYNITACTWVHEKWPHMVPDGKILLRGFLGKAGQIGLLDQTDEEMATKVQADLKEMIGLQGEPLFYEVSRMKEAMPQYTVGHQERLAMVEGNLKHSHPTIFLAGMSYRGVGIPDCIQAGKAAADEAGQLLELMKQ